MQKPLNIKDDNYKGTVCACYHCGERFGSAGGACALTCKDCRTAEQRKLQHEENKRIIGENWKCRVCKD